MLLLNFRAQVVTGELRMMNDFLLIFKQSYLYLKFTINNSSFLILYLPIIVKNWSSEIIFILAIFFAFSSLLPASSPTTK